MVQTFVPIGTTFEESARSLDRVRLGNQRMEAYAILLSLQHGGGWEMHPTARMWKDYQPALAQYIRAVILEWKSRGYRNNMVIPRYNPRAKVPEWWGYPPLHRSHRESLLHKDYDWYVQFFPNDVPRFNYYYWPT